MSKELTPAIGYVRVNTPHVLSESEDQRRNIEGWAQRTGHLIVGWVEDILVPGAGGNEAGLDELIARVQHGEARVVAVEDHHRISRRLDVYQRWSDRLAQVGGRLERTGALDD
ncbi:MULTISPECIES: recombinase family protein [Streptomyces]|uniref:recombinase family protein n=1 Tax=Streptomyces TaxID=1883 RepID=UPI001E522DBB|nr:MULTISPECIES: recombinase family protein [Streptomyces]UFQ16427.1 recombinase family protein [Streptomyces huasconensis]WCL86029.1 recombinase family protein [Streptomyces sp. JCM 35825]